MKWNKVIAIIAVVILISLPACSLQAATPASSNAGAAATPTRTKKSPKKPVVHTPTPTKKTPKRPTHTPGGPTVSVSVDTNCRIGPGNAYEMVGGLKVGETAAVVGKDAFGEYWIIEDENTPDGTCWIWGQYATVKGNTDNLPVVAAPPTPTPTPTQPPSIILAPPVSGSIVTDLSLQIVYTSGSCANNTPAANYELHITSNGPTTVTYYLEQDLFDGTFLMKIDQNPMVLSQAGRLTYMGTFQSTYACGTYILKAVVTSPNHVETGLKWESYH
jgi:uncharacterized protein YgiM (DUF1202 family)